MFLFCIFRKCIWVQFVEILLPFILTLIVSCFVEFSLFSFSILQLKYFERWRLWVQWMKVQREDSWNLWSKFKKTRSNKRNLNKILWRTKILSHFRHFMILGSRTQLKCQFFFSHLSIECLAERDNLKNIKKNLLWSQLHKTI